MAEAKELNEGVSKTPKVADKANPPRSREPTVKKPLLLVTNMSSREVVIGNHTLAPKGCENGKDKLTFNTKGQAASFMASPVVRNLQRLKIIKVETNGT